MVVGGCTADSDGNKEKGFIKRRKWRDKLKGRGRYQYLFFSSLK